MKSMWNFIINNSSHNLSLAFVFFSLVFVGLTGFLYVSFNCTSFNCTVYQTACTRLCVCTSFSSLTLTNLFYMVICLSVCLSVCKFVCLYVIRPAPCLVRPREINNVRVRFHTMQHGDLAKYWCDPGFELEGPEYATCLYGNWTEEPQPNCKRSKSRLQCVLSSFLYVDYCFKFNGGRAAWSYVHCS